MKSKTTALRQCTCEQATGTQEKCSQQRHFRCALRQPSFFEGGKRSLGVWVLFWFIVLGNTGLFLSERDWCAHCSHSLDLKFSSENLYLLTFGRKD
ncbi:hypothetical protein CDAR_243951 [Caerostris darwini]|uniref:LITAF domain-containing protein n=1 Tax=Caerostris darwini TaxID=1538125 RepID=A0AAV4W476_9ARAC|nr:hypothetical protein CDAR_243951 [Caerostris darwini]